MKKFLLFCAFIPFAAMAQKKNVVNASRYFPRVDKVLEFEKALTAHAQKYHTGNFRWRVFDIQSGPDAGGYHITEGPCSWEDIDSRGDMGKEHLIDWNKNVAIYLTDKYSSSYSVFSDSLSSVALTDYSKFINISHVDPKIGWGYKFREVLKKFNKVWVSSGESIAVYTSNSSGPNQFALVTRYKNGLKEKASDYRKPFKERYEAMYGADSWEEVDEVYKKYIDNTWSELLSYREDLSSK